MNRSSAGIALAALLMGLAGCQTGDPAARLARPDHSIQVKESRAVLQLAVAPEMRQLTIHDRSKIESFVAFYKDRGHGEFVIAMPSGGPSAEAAVALSSEAREIAYEMGINWDRMAGAGYDASDKRVAPIVFSFTVYEAIAPECPSLATIDIANMRGNDPTPAFGCTLEANLAAMIADPADLLGTRTMTSADNDRRQTVLEKYRAGESTASARSDQESGQVSDAVQ